MQQSTVKFWLILALAVLLAAASIGLVLKLAKFLLWLILLAILTPVFYLLLKMILPKSLTNRFPKNHRRN